MRSEPASSDKALGALALGVVVICLAVLGATATTLLVPSWQGRFATPPAVSYVVGETIDISADIYRGHQATLVIFADASCKASIGSQPVFGALVRSASEGAVGISLMMPGETGRPSEPNLAFAHTIGVQVADLRQADLRPLRLRSVPAAVLVGRDGTILAYHEGLFADADVDRLLTMLRSTSSLARAF